MKGDKLSWTTQRRFLSELVDFDKNPRKLSDKEAKQLRNSLKKFGYVELVAVDADNTILAGHMRVRTMRALGQDDEIEVRVPSRPLSEKEREEYCIRSNRNSGEFDYDILANEFQLDDLLEWGFDEKDFEVSASAMDEAGSGEGKHQETLLTKLSFTLSHEQAELVQRCLEMAKAMGEFVERVNESEDGNALARICELWKPRNA